MPAPIPAVLASAVVAPIPFATASPLDGAAGAFLSALAPVWPALQPWLVVVAVVLVMWIATEVVVRELQRLQRVPLAGRGAARPDAPPRAPRSLR